MNSYVTVFDHVFLPQFVALAHSLERHAPTDTLWAFCVDGLAAHVVNDLSLPNVHVVNWEEVEPDHYGAVREGRSAGEYCWTLTPRAVLTVMDLVPANHSVTYVDTDVWLVSAPTSFFDEFTASGAAVMIMEHGFAPENDKGTENGMYCVQFMPFRGSEARQILDRWESQCLEWCFANADSGRFGDQKYLDEWRSEFGHQVHVLTRPQSVMAPWNTTRFPLSEANAFHFHGLRLLPGGKVWIGDYPVAKHVFERLYCPYLSELTAAIARLRAIGFEAPPQSASPPVSATLRNAIHRLRRDRSVTRRRSLHGH